jgi:urea transport system substrate-binding protein
MNARFNKPLRRLPAQVGTLGLVCTLLAACGGGADKGDDDVLDVGVLAPITGSLAPYGEALERGMKVGTKLINADGGIGGKSVKYTLIDDQTDPKAAAAGARRLTTRDHVDVLLGTTSSPTTLAAIPFAEQAHIPFIYPAEGEVKTCDDTGKAARDFVFSMGVTPEQKLKTLVPALVKKPGTRVYLIGSDYVFPQTVNDAAIKELEGAGAKIVGEDYAPLGTSEFASFIAKIKDADPDVIFIDVVGTDGVAFVQQLKQFGLSDKVVLTGFPTFAAEALGGLVDASQGAITADPYAETVDNEINAKFVAAYKKEYGDDSLVSPMAAMGAYGSLLLLQSAAESAGSTDPQDIAKALPGTTVDTAAGEIEMGDNHVVKSPILVLKVEGDGYTIDKTVPSVEHDGFVGCSSKGL